MAITATLLVVDGTNFTKLKSYVVEYNKLWKDSDRNMNGDVRATLIGIFPKIVAKTNKMSLAEIGTFCSKLDQAYFSVTYFDPRTATTKTANYYAADYKVSLEDRTSSRFGEVDFSLVPVSKRT